MPSRTGCEKRAQASRSSESTRAPTSVPAEIDLLAIGAPTQNRGLSTRKSREQAQSMGGAPVTDGVREWIASVDVGTDTSIATFDTSTGTNIFAGSAARDAGKKLKGRGHTAMAEKIFLVKGTKGPLQSDQIEEATAWGSDLVNTRLAAPGSEQR